MYGVIDGEKLGAMRQERGLSRQDLARQAGISPATVSKAERGHRVRGKTAWKVSSPKFAPSEGALHHFVLASPAEG
jgi:transcriptional regulator with XRE-family HTH domain